ncbi:MAG TPA: IS110 family transposase [Candidatus Nitrosotenuis sp.]|nr:IS110 family transposase [Candidatus Nitrosotenuis sp.]
MIYAALDLGQKTIQAVLKDRNGKLIKEAKIEKKQENVLEFLKNTNASIVMESGYNHQFLYDLLRKDHTVKVAHPFMVKAIAYAKVKTDKVDARMLADLLRSDMIPECCIPDERIRQLRDLRRRRHYFVQMRTMLKNKVKAELAKRWIDPKANPFTQAGRKWASSLHREAIDDWMDAIEFFDGKIRQADCRIEKIASDDNGKHLITMPGISYYAALLISADIDIGRLADYEHLCSYARLVPGTYQSGSRQYQRPDSRMLSWILVQCVHVHVRWCRVIHNKTL